MIAVPFLDRGSRGCLFVGLSVRLGFSAFFSVDGV